MLSRLPSILPARFCRLFSSASLTDTLPTIEDESLAKQPWYQTLLDCQPNYDRTSFLEIIEQQPTAPQLFEALNLHNQYPPGYLHPHLRLIGFHGTSTNSLPMLFPTISPLVCNQGQFHSAKSKKNQNLHIADSLAAARHYAHINSLFLSSYINATHYDPGMILAVFTSLYASKKLSSLTRRPLIGHDHKRNLSRRRGNEMLVPHEQFEEFSMLPLYKTPAVKRLTPLKENQTVNIKGKQYRWNDGHLTEVHKQFDLRPSV
ncbi:MAG: hypothetical protein P1U34_12585 [Coxiellaceae bacterium]|nr:hypothetical protein [Coxiellaceae bacterium]